MGQRQMRFTVPDGAACGSVVMSQDESVLILLQHCQEMKRQETRLRLISLLLLLSCVGLFIFTQLQRNSGPSGQQSDVEPSQLSTRKEYFAADSQTNTERLRIDLTSMRDPNRTCQTTMEWAVMLGENYDQERRAIVIPVNGVYLVYIRMTFRCAGKDTGSEILHVKLNKRNEGHSKVKLLVNAVDSVQCRPGLFRTMSILQLFSLTRGDQLSISLEEGYGLITHASFGAVFT